MTSSNVVFKRFPPKRLPPKPPPKKKLPPKPPERGKPKAPPRHTIIKSYKKPKLNKESKSQPIPYPPTIQHTQTISFNSNSNDGSMVINFGDFSNNVFPIIPTALCQSQSPPITPMLVSDIDTLTDNNSENDDEFLDEKEDLILKSKMKHKRGSTFVIKNMRNSFSNRSIKNSNSVIIKSRKNRKQLKNGRSKSKEYKQYKIKAKHIKTRVCNIFIHIYTHIYSETLVTYIFQYKYIVYRIYTCF